MENGGPGIKKILTINKALMDKFLWRFAMEMDGPWRRVIDAKLGAEPFDKFPKPVNSSHGYSLWRYLLVKRDSFPGDHPV